MEGWNLVYGQYGSWIRTIWAGRRACARNGSGDYGGYENTGGAGNTGQNWRNNFSDLWNERERIPDRVHFVRHLGNRQPEQCRETACFKGIFGQSSRTWRLHPYSGWWLYWFCCIVYHVQREREPGDKITSAPFRDRIYMWHDGRKCRGSELYYCAGQPCIYRRKPAWKPGHVYFWNCRHSSHHRGGISDYI